MQVRACEARKLEHDDFVLECASLFREQLEDLTQPSAFITAMVTILHFIKHRTLGGPMEVDAPVVAGHSQVDALFYHVVLPKMIQFQRGPREFDYLLAMLVRELSQSAFGQIIRSKNHEQLADSRTILGTDRPTDEVCFGDDRLSGPREDGEGGVADPHNTLV